MKAAKIFDKIDAVIAQILEWALIITAAGMIPADLLAGDCQICVGAVCTLR